MTPIHVVGIGLDGVTGLVESVRQLVEQATLLVGSPRHLSYFPTHPAERLILGDFTDAIRSIKQACTNAQIPPSPLPTPHSPLPTSPLIVILTSGDPLFFGLGRLLLMEVSPDQLTFHPHLSSIQLAFSRIKRPWQDAQIISAHGRSLDELTQALQQGAEKIAVLTDKTNSPGAIAHLLQALDLPIQYRMWICENLGGSNEQIVEMQDFASLQMQTFAPLNVVVLEQVEELGVLELDALPILGVPDQAFLSFRDRPRLMTKREVRVLVLAELALQSPQTIWDVGAGTGSVSIEMARLCPNSQIYAIEKTAVGAALIQKNCQRFQVNNVTSIHGTAPQALQALPQPDRIFIGGSGGNLNEILDICGTQLKVSGRIVLALATLEHLNTTLTWFTAQSSTRYYWNHHLLQIQLSRSVPVATLTRFAPLNPVTLVVIEKTRREVRSEE